jgi:hypothetical protein
MLFCAAGLQGTAVLVVLGSSRSQNPPQNEGTHRLLYPFITATSPGGLEKGPRVPILTESPSALVSYGSCNKGPQARRSSLSVLEAGSVRLRPQRARSLAAVGESSSLPVPAPVFSSHLQCPDWPLHHTSLSCVSSHHSPSMQFPLFIRHID